MSVTIVLTPPAAFINANQRLHHYKRNELTQAWRTAAREAVEAGFNPYRYDRCHIICTYRFATNHRREVSNLQPTSKAIVDGLVDALVVADDDDLHVVGPDNRREWPNGEPRVTVTVEPIGEASCEQCGRPPCPNEARVDLQAGGWMHKACWMTALNEVQP